MAPAHPADPGYRLKPLVRADLLGARSSGGTSNAALVGTGLLPIRARASGGQPISLRPGQFGVLDAGRPAGGLIRVHIGAQLSPALWLLLACCWLLPLAVLVAVGGRPREPSASR